MLVDQEYKNSEKDLKFESTNKVRSFPPKKLKLRLKHHDFENSN